MNDSIYKGFTLKDGTEVQVKLKSADCYEFFLFSPDGKEDTFTLVVG